MVSVSSRPHPGTLRLSAVENSVAVQAESVAGRAAVLAGTSHAPLTAILLAFEITGDYSLILPVMLATAVSTLLARALRRDSIYTEKLTARGIDLDRREDLVLRSVTLGEVMDPIPQAVRAEARSLFESAIAPTIYPEAVERIREHQKLGHAVCIVSGATDLVVEPLAERLGVEHAIYTQLEVADGRYTGRVIEPICFEEGKVHWLRGFIEAERIDLSRSYFYTDSVTDRALLDLVGHPQVVNPDPLLYRLAVRRRWPVCFYDGEGDERTGRERALV